MTKFNPFEVSENSRDFDQVELFNKVLTPRFAIVASWGLHARKLFGRGLRFTVSGMIHKGHVYVFLSANDTFEVHLTSRRGRLIETIKDVYLEDLIETIDIKVERIKNYRF